MPQIYNQAYSEFRPDEYVYAKDKQEVVTLLKQYGEAARVVGAGITMHEMAVLGFLPHVKKLIDIRNLGLDYVQSDGQVLRIGASTRLRDLADNNLIRKQASLNAVIEAVDSIPIQVANAATIGGNLCSAVPIVSMPPVLMTLNAQLVLTGEGEERVVSLDDFYIDYLITDLHPGEFLTEVRIPLNQGNRYSTYLAEKMVAVDYPAVSLSVSTSVSKDSKFEQVRVAAGSAGNVPLRLHETEKTLQGKKGEDTTIEKAATTAAKEIDPSSDLRASADYRRTLTKYLLKRALTNCMKTLKIG